MHHARVCFGLETKKRNKAYMCMTTLEHRTAVDVELNCERHSERIIFGAIKEGFVLFERDSAWHPLVVDVRPNVFAHQELMQVPLLPILV